MKKTELKIKDNITMEDKIKAIEAIADSCFMNGDYIPYFLESSTVNYFAIYFIDNEMFILSLKSASCSACGTLRYPARRRTL